MRLTSMGRVCIGIGCALASLIALTGCRDDPAGPAASGTEGGTDGGSGDDGDGDGDDDGPSAAGCGDVVEVGDAPLRRLTRTEYNNTVRDLLGDTTAPADAFPPDDTALGFEVASHVSELVAQHYMDAAIAVATRATEDLDSLLPCDPAGDEEACIHAFIDDVAPRAYRRPLDDAERASLQGLYAAARAQFSVSDSVATVLEAVLQSPNFLYRAEFGLAEGEDDIVALSGYEMASRLSYLLWSTMPDDTLVAAGEAGELYDSELLEAHARRMLEDPRAGHTIASFHRQWLDLDPLTTASKDPALYPEWTDTLAAAMLAEAEAFATHVIMEGDGRLETLLTADFTYADAELAALYGVSGVGAAGPERIDFPPGQRAGLLTSAGVMARLAKADQSDPVLRGRFVREALLCQTLAAAPPDVDVTPPPVDPNTTTRERFSQHSTDPSCAGCHILLDPVGFGFEHYDAVGRFRSEDAGFPVDASGEMVATEDIDGPFDGALELSTLLSGSEEVRRCVATQWFRFAFARATTDADDCTETQIYDAFAASDHDVRELLVGLVLSDGFRFRPVITEGA